MQLQTELIPLNLAEFPSLWDAVLACLKKTQASDKAVLRWGLVSSHKEGALLEIGTISGTAQVPAPVAAINESSQAGVHVAFVIPTGVGAAVGGFSGDAGPIAKALEAVADSVILHPNVVNAADFYGGGCRSLYVDGLTLDRFFNGEIRLRPRRHARIGLILDRLDSCIQSQVLNSANALRAVSGIDILGYAVCEEKIRSRICRSKMGHYAGEVENPAVLFQAAEVLQDQGANALAVVTATGGIPEGELTRHYAGIGPNPVGALEALISRSLTWKTGLPCAHAPAFVDGLGKSPIVVDPRAASEVASGSGLPCILYGLAQSAEAVEQDGVGIGDLSAVIVPFSCAGGPPALAAHRFGVPLLAVRANTCIVGVSADLLSVRIAASLENYAEAIAFVACRKAGVTWESIGRPLGLMRRLQPTGLRHATQVSA